MKQNDGGPAFPCDESHGDNYEGMTLRDYFAAKAMQAIVSKSPLRVAGLGINKEMEMTARGSYAVADAMLAARDK